MDWLVCILFIIHRNHFIDCLNRNDDEAGFSLQIALYNLAYFNEIKGNYCK